MLLVHQVNCIHCGTTAEKGTSEVLYHYSQEDLVVYSLATAKGVHTSGGKCKVYLPDKGTRSIIIMSCQRWLSVLLQIFKCSDVEM